MDWEAPRNEVASAPGAAARPLFQIDPREIALHALTSVPRAAVAAACAFALLLAVYVAIPTRYAAKAVVVADPRIGSATEEATPNIARDSAALESLVEVATTDGFLIGVVRGQKLDDDPEFASSAGEIAVVEKLRSRLTIERLGTTYVFEVSVKSRESTRAAALANAVADALVDHVRTERGAMADAAARRLADQVDELRTAVAASGKAAADYRARMGLVDAGRDANTAERSYSDLSRQVADAAGAMQAARSRLDEIARGSGAAGGALDAVGSPLLTTLRARQSDLRQQIAEMEGIYGDRHPQIRRLQDRLAETGQQLATEGARLRAVAQADYDVARRRHEALAADLAAAKVSVAAVGTASADLTALELKAKADSDAYEAALARYQKALASGVSPELEMTVSSPAQPPLRPTKRTLGFVAPIAAVLSLPLGFFAALGLSLARRGVRSAAEVEALLGLPVVAVVPRGRLVPAGAVRRLIGLPAIDVAADLVGRVGHAVPGARVLVADTGTVRSAGAIARRLAALLAGAGVAAATRPATAAPPPALVREQPRRGWRRAGQPEPPPPAPLPPSVDLVTAEGGRAAEQAAAAGVAPAAAVLVLPWNALPAADLRAAAARLLPDPRTPAMVVFTI